MSGSYRVVQPGGQTVYGSDMVITENASGNSIVFNAHLQGIGGDKNDAITGKILYNTMIETNSSDPSKIPQPYAGLAIRPIIYNGKLADNQVQGGNAIIVDTGVGNVNNSWDVGLKLAGNLGIGMDYHGIII